MGILSFFLFFLLVIESSHQERSSSTEMRTPGAPLDSMELVTTLAGSREWALLPARHRTVPAASRVTGHTGPPASDPGAGSPENPSAGTVTHLLTHSHPPGEFYGCGSPCQLLPAHGLSTASGLGSIPAPQLQMRIFERNPISEKLGLAF